jgi:hypothetical protein
MQGGCVVSLSIDAYRTPPCLDPFGNRQYPIHRQGFFLSQKSGCVVWLAGRGFGVVPSEFE